MAKVRSRRRNQDQHIALILEITRQDSPEAAPWVQRIRYEANDVAESVARALTRINDEDGWLDEEGHPVTHIEWESSCLQRKCGACAMIIDGVPQLACGSLLRDHKGNGPLTIAPLAKFAVVRDLRVDRTAMRENLLRFGMWQDGPASLDDSHSELAYEASRCMQCGLCLEVCPNYVAGGSFFGAAGSVPAARLLACQPPEHARRLREAYVEHEYEPCAKSLACMDVCPAEIDIERLLARNASAAL